MIELLVVIAVIAILTAVAGPLFKSAKARTNRVRCSSNLRQLSMGFSLYQQEYESFPYGFCDLMIEKAGSPPPDGYAGTLSHDNAGWWWFNYLYNTLETDQKPGSIYWCPARKIPELGVKENILCGNYGVNRSVCVDAQGVAVSSFVGEPLKPGGLRRPSATYLMGDSGYSLISWMAVSENIGDPYENPRRVNFFYLPGLELNRNRTELLENTDAIKGRHPSQQINLIFADGHLETGSADLLRCGQTSFDPDSLPQLWFP